MKKIFSAFLLSFMVLTRLPVLFRNRIEYSGEIVGLSSAFFPVAGLFYGLVWAALTVGVRCFSNDASLLAVILLAVPYLLNNFLHLDGLADTLDAFLADRSKEQRLLIMKDSRTGSFALGGTVLLMIFKFLLMKKILGSQFCLPLLTAIPVLSRFGIVLLSFISVYPRKEGTGKNLIGRIKPAVLLTAVLITLIILFSIHMISHQPLLPALTAGLLFVIPFILLVKTWSYKKIGGVTGDVLGASLEMLEPALMSVFLIIIRIIK